MARPVGPRPVEDLLVQPLFYDLLSGEFRLPNDPNWKQHTLGRLACATYEKGEEIDKFADEEILGFQYTPSWAPRVKSTIMCPKDIATGIITLEGLALENDNGAKVDIHHSWGGSPAAPNTVRIYQNQNETALVLIQSLAVNLSGERDRATEIAQEFFARSV